jgi:tetratricopeptide (TPR) repeat protein
MTAGGATLATPGNGVDGARAAVTVPERSTELAVTAGPATASQRYTIRLEEEPAVPDWLTRARDLRRKGSLDEAQRTLDEAPPSDGSLAAAVASLRGSIALARGQSATAIELMEKSADAHMALGEISIAAENEAARLYLLIEARHFADARASLARLERFVRGYPVGVVHAHYNAGTLAQETGDLRTALQELDDARIRAERVGDERLLRRARQALAVPLLYVGRVDEALATLTELEATAPASASACERASALFNLGCTALLAREAPFARKDRILDPAVPLAKAENLYETACSRPAPLGATRAYLALAHVEAGDIAAARSALRAATAAPAKLDPRDAFFARDVEGQIALAEGNVAAALAAYDALAASASGLSPFDEVAAAIGRSTAFERTGGGDRALAAIRAGASLLDEAARAVPLGEGRGAFWWARTRIAQREVRLLLDMGRGSEALAVARRARAHVIDDVDRARTVASLEPAARARWEAALAAYRSARDDLAARAADDWKLSAEALARVVSGRHARDVELRASLDATAAEVFSRSKKDLLPLAGEEGTAAFLWFPLESDWASFGIAAGSLRAERVSAPVDPTRMPDAAKELVAWGAKTMAHATRVSLLPVGPLRDVDLAALPVDGAPLIERAAVEYPFDADAVDIAASDGPALVVVDPTLTLPAARREGAATTATDAKILVGREATRERVLDELARARSFYFTGHAAYAGVDGWESALLLAGRERLGVADVLALPRAPGLVILSGCETGREGTQGGASGLGLADAFLAAGSRAVFASVRRVDDETTARLMRTLREQLAAHPGEPARALQGAQLALRAADPTADWAAFRVFVR